MKNNTYTGNDEESIDLIRWISIFFNNWYFFFVFEILALVTAFIVIKFSAPQYELKASILVRNDKNPLDKNQLFSAVLYSDPYQLDNQRGIIQSKSVVRNALLHLNFQTGYFIQHKFSKRELYNNSPFMVERDTSFLQPLGIFFTIKFLNDSLMSITAEGDDVLLYDYSTFVGSKQIAHFQFCDTIKFGQITGNSYCRFALLPDNQFFSEGTSNETYYFRFYSLEELIYTFRNFKIENEKSSSILNILFRYGEPYKAADFLNVVTAEYLMKGIQRDNNIAQATIGFIDAQLVDIVDSLHSSGQRMQSFKESSKVLDLGFQAEKVYSKLEQFESDKAKLLVKKRFFNYLLENLKSKSDVSDLIAPTTLEINDPVLNNLIMELADLYSERAELSFNSIKNNPYLSSLELKIDDTRRKLVESARNVLDATEIAFEEIESQILVAEKALNRLPKEQQQYFNIERKFKLNDELYTYLLTRRSEMEIFKASNIPANEILDKAEVSDSKLVSPNIRLSLITAFLLGLIIPGAFIYLRETINNKIRSRDDLQQITNIPVVGQIVGSKTSALPAVLTEPNSQLTETYRTLRTNLQFILDESVSNTILVTSAIQGEGKSYTALNLAAVYGTYRKKTILLDLDLRKSAINKYLGIETTKGMSNYLSKNASLDEVIYTERKINFDLIPAGPVPPNPSELISSAQIPELLGKLKKKYDIIIIDSPPMVMVSDALLIYTYVDRTLLVVRYNYTSFEVIENVVEDMKVRKIEKVNIVLNDVDTRFGKYGYRYGYGYGYYTNGAASNGLKMKRS